MPILNSSLPPYCATAVLQLSSESGLPGQIGGLGSVYITYANVNSYSFSLFFPSRTANYD